MVWIDWRGSHPLTVTFVDGSHDDAGESSPTTGSSRAPGFSRLSNRPMLHHRSVRDVVGEAGPLTRLLPEAWLDVQDRKWMSRGTFETAGAPPLTGWAIHEVVRFP